MTTMVFGYLILISHRFLCFLLSFISFEKIYQTLKIVFDHISKNVKVQYFRLSSWFSEMWSNTIVRV